MRIPSYINRFKKDLKLMVKRGHDPHPCRKTNLQAVEFRWQGY